MLEKWKESCNHRVVSHESICTVDLFMEVTIFIYDTLLLEQVTVKI